MLINSMDCITVLFAINGELRWKFQLFVVPFSILTIEAANTTMNEFVNTEDPDKMAHLDLQCLPSNL